MLCQPSKLAQSENYTRARDISDVGSPVKGKQCAFVCRSKVNVTDDDNAIGTLGNSAVAEESSSGTIRCNSEHSEQERVTEVKGAM